MRAFLKVIALVLCIALVFPISALAAKNTFVLVKPPDRTSFYEGLDWAFVGKEVATYHDFDIAGTILSNNGAEIPYFKDKWFCNMWVEPEEGDWKVGINDVRYIVEDLEEYYAAGQLGLYTITGIEIDRLPYDTTYIRGVDWDYGENGKVVIREMKFDGLRIKVNCSDGGFYYMDYDKKSGRVQWSIDDYFEFKVGENYINALFLGWETPYPINIELEKITELRVIQKPAKTSYNYGSGWKRIHGEVVPDIDLSGLKVRAYYNNGDIAEFAYDDCPEKFAIAENQSFAKRTVPVGVVFDSQAEVEINMSFNMFGDVNFDGVINSTDALNILKYSAGMVSMAESQLFYADVTDDGRVNSADALAILNKNVGLIRFFEAEL